MTCMCNCSGKSVATLNFASKKQITRAFCKACSGRKPLVNGIEPVSSKKSSKKDIKFMDITNPNLVWKIRRRRSTIRRPRKPTAASEKFDLKLRDNKPLSVFESEKLGVAVLGQRFAEKAVDIPIKKRRLVLQSESPEPQSPLIGEVSLALQPKTPSQHTEEFDFPDMSSKFTNMLKIGSNGTMNSNVSDLTNKEYCRSVDFSGIELLADAACNSSELTDHVVEFSLEGEHANPEGIDFSANIIKETMVLPVSDGTSVLGNNIPVLHKHHDGNGLELERPLRSRLHWDLNVMPDEWEEPSNDPPFDHHENYSEGEKSEACGRASEIPGDRDSYREELNTDNCKLPDTQNSPCKSENVQSLLSAPKAEETSSSTPFLSAPKDEETSSSAPTISAPKAEETSSTPTSACGETVVAADSEGQAVVASITDSSEHDLTVPTAPEISLTKCEGELVGKEDARGELLPLEVCKTCPQEVDAINYGGSSFLHDEIEHATIKVQSGYDSPFEDGELREPIACAWGEDELQDREADCVECVSYDVYEDDFESVTHSPTVNTEFYGEDGRNMEDCSSVKDVDGEVIAKRISNAVPDDRSEQCVRRDALKQQNRLTKSNGWYQSRDHSESVNSEANGGSLRKFYPEKRNFQYESKEPRGNSSHPAYYGPRNRSDNVGNSYYRGGKDFGSEKSFGREKLSWQGRGRDESDGRRINSSAGGYSRDFNGHLGRRNSTGDSISKSGGLNRNDNCRQQNYSRGMFRPLSRMRSPSERNDSYNNGQPKSYATRGRPGFYPQELREVPQDEYHEARPYYVERQKHVFSPDFERGGRSFRPPRQSWSRSRSRSRSRSPNNWRFHRERNMGSRRQSPDYRERIHSQKPSFPVNTDGFVSPTRVHSSPQRKPRFFDDRDFTNNHIRERRPSPVRTFRQSQRFDYPERKFKSDDHSGPTARPERFQQMPGAFRGSKYEDSFNERTEHNGRYEVMNRVSNYDAGGRVGGGMRRFKYDSKDSQVAQNSHRTDDFFRGAVSKHVHGNIKEEGGPPKVNSGSMIRVPTGSTSAVELDDCKKVAVKMEV